MMVIECLFSKNRGVKWDTCVFYKILEMIDVENKIPFFLMQ